MDKKPIIWDTRSSRLPSKKILPQALDASIVRIYSSFREAEDDSSSENTC